MNDDRNASDKNISKKSNSEQISPKPLMLMLGIPYLFMTESLQYVFIVYNKHDSDHLTPQFPKTLSLDLDGTPKE